MNSGTYVCVAALALAGLAGVALAQQPPPVDSAAALMAQRKQYAEVLSAEAAKSQERVAAISQQLQSLDKDIESRVERIVKLLSAMRDSTDSRGRVRHMKDKAIAGLRNSITYYVRERDRRNQELAAGGSAASKEGLAQDVTKIDARIEKRVGQILDLANSMTQSEEFGRYERYRNTEYDYSAETKEFRRHEKDVSGSARTKAELAQELKASVDKQTREIKDLQDVLLMTSDPQRKARVQEQIAEKEEIVSERRRQAEELLSAPAPDTRPVSSEGAFETDKLLAEMTLELQQDFRKFQQLAAERNEAQARSRYNQDRLERFLKSLSPSSSAR